MDKQNTLPGNSIVFKPRVSHKTVWMFYVVIGVFLLISILIPFLMGDEGLPAAAGMGVFSLFLLFIVWRQTAAKSIVYRVNSDGIYLKRLWLKTIIPFNTVESIEIIDEKKTEQLANDIDEERVKGINNLDLADAFKGQMDFGKLIQYSSVQFVVSETSGGSGYRINGHSTNTDGGFIYIKAQPEIRFLISPLEMESFLSMVVKSSNGVLQFQLENSKRVIPSELP